MIYLFNQVVININIQLFFKPTKLSDKTHKYNDIQEEKTVKYENRLKILNKRHIEKILPNQYFFL